MCTHWLNGSRGLWLFSAVDHISALNWRAASATADTDARRRIQGQPRFWLVPTTFYWNRDATSQSWPRGSRAGRACRVKLNYRVLMCTNYSCGGNVLWQCRQPYMWTEALMTQNKLQIGKMDTFGRMQQHPSLRPPLTSLAHRPDGATSSWPSRQ